MYSVVMMMALGGTGEVPDFGRRCSCSCSGYCSGYCSGCYGGRRARCCGCCGGYYYTTCHGGYGCSGCAGRPVMPYQKGEKLPPPKKGEGNETSASLIVTLPAVAKLTIDGRPTKATSENRSFVTPPLEPGWNYQYQLRAEIVRDGSTRVLSQNVRVRAGEETRVSLMDFTNAEVVGNSKEPE